MMSQDQNKNDQNKKWLKPTKKKIDAKNIAGLFKNSGGPAPLRRRINRKTAALEPMEPVSVSNLLELQEIVNHLKPDGSQDPDAKPITVSSTGTRFADENFRGDITIPQSGDQSMTRKTLLEGFDMLKKRQETLQAMGKIDLDDFGGFYPASLRDITDQITWVDRFITNRLGGRREGLLVVWEIPEGKYQMDPWTCKLEKIDD
jgi:hypothetical protein